MNNKWFFIINPTSGSGKAKKDWTHITEILYQHKIEFDFDFSEYAGHAVVLATNAIENGFRKICAVGGDGTMHQLANAVLKQNKVASTEILLAIIPVGTGNDWARIHHLPFQYEEAVVNLKREKQKLSDVIEVKQGDAINYSIIIAGCGFDAHVSAKAHQQKQKGRGGKLVYLLELAKGVFSYRSMQVEWQTSKSRGKEKTFSIAVGNLHSNVGGMMQCPEANPNDGVLDITIIKHLTIPQVFANVPRLFNGTILKSKHVIGMKMESISLTGENCLLELDGENCGSLPATFTAKQNAIKVLVGSD